jgi:hypothetical protein
MPTGATGQLGLALPVQGELSGTWGNTVNNAITEYTNIAIAATLTLTNDGAVTLANTTGTDLATNITSSLTGAGTVTAQFAIVRVTGTLTTAKVVTAPSYSKTYTVVNAATGGIVTFKASGQTGVSIAVGESAFVYFNGTDYVKLAGTVDTGVTSFTAGTTGFTPSTGTTGAVTLAGTLATTNGGTGLTSFTSGGVVYASSSSALATGSALTLNGTTLGVNGTNASIAVDSGGIGGIATVLGIVGTSTGYVGTTTNTVFNILSNNSIRISVAPTTTTLSGSIYIENSNAINELTFTGSDYTNLVSNSTNAFDIGTNVAGPVLLTTNSVERMRITSAGNVGIGTSSPNYNLQVAGTSNQISILNPGYGAFMVGLTTNLDFTFTKEGTGERARITSTGGFVVGTTTDPGNGIIADVNGNVRTVPQSGSSKTSSYTLATTDIGEYILLGASGAIVIPDATFAAGDVVTIFNNTASTATITCSITTAYIAGTFTDKATMTLAAAGVATVLFISGTLCVVSGNVT